MDNEQEIMQVTQAVIDLAKPERIILFTRKENPRGETSSFKLCVVSDLACREELERKIYLSVDSDISFDVLVYSCEQWREQSSQKGSFAHKVLETGRVLYEK